MGTLASITLLRSRLMLTKSVIRREILSFDPAEFFSAYRVRHRNKMSHELNPAQLYLKTRDRDQDFYRIARNPRGFREMWKRDELFLE